MAMENCQVPELFRPLGVNWIRKFIARHTELRSRREQQLEIDRVSASDPSIITAWFIAIGRLLVELGVRPRNMWNADEIGTRHNHHQSESAVFNIQQGAPVSILSSDTTWSTIMECINAEGQAIMPLVLHQGKVPLQPFIQWFPPAPECPHWYWGFTKKGWISNNYVDKWFTEVFEPQTRDGNAVRVLFIDGHQSHLTGQLQLHAFNANVKIIWILPYMSHLLQPLDQQPFATLKAQYSRVLKRYDPTGEQAIGRANFNLIWKEARDIAFTEDCIRSGWRRACLHPLNLEAMLNRRLVANHRPTTPDLLPPKTMEYGTPKRKPEWKPILDQLSRGVTLDLQPQIHRIERHLDELEAEATLLRREVKLQRTVAKAVEGRSARKRMKKTNTDIITNVRDVVLANGGSEEEADLLIAQNPSSLALMDEEYEKAAKRKRGT